MFKRLILWAAVAGLAAAVVAPRPAAARPHRELRHRIARTNRRIVHRERRWERRHPKAMARHNRNYRVHQRRIGRMVHHERHLRSKLAHKRHRDWVRHSRRH
ncbi:MAG TPA: hypothetical protein VFU47_15425 [Armatimonadota bacterium]|nr:hypothetical protein [Armatimonadota bacterium]